jgi:hypothetical protein
MSAIADYFKREKYITRRLSLLVLGGTLILVPITVACGHGRIPIRVLEWAIAAYVVFVALAVVLIVRTAHAKFPKSDSPDNSPLDAATRRKLRRRIWFLELFAAIYALGLLNALWHARGNQWLATVIGAVITLLIEFVLFKTIFRLKDKLKAPAAAIDPRAAEAASRIE